MYESDQTRILLVDDHAATRETIKELVEQRRGWVVSAEAGSGHQAVGLADECKPDVVVMDMQMPDGNGLEASVDMLGENPELNVLIVSNYVDSALVKAALEVGVLGYISKENVFEELAPAIEAVSHKKHYLCKRIKLQTRLP